ncbi:hypothetical protein RvY_05905 [Ramazzottius varieornatus]|uniref:dAMP1 SANT/Myb-like domain-containing protein n=1 Tax=Ramazzottius varieornatus TaxID=947166 RepID=A0A1D1UWR1_RAMVA|nr:hypothetical protein RvY_05905 [Ramazzottius varieornatus]
MAQHVYDMLGTDRNEATSSGASAAKLAKSSAKAKKTPKPKGMSRELFNIMAIDGDLPEQFSTIPSTAPSSDSWKKTINRDKKRRARKWLMTHFSPSNRPGALKYLAHWCKAEDADKEYPFAKLEAHTFTEPLRLPSFTSSEFQHLPVDPNEPWSEDATRHLFDLVSQFDLRFEILQYSWNSEAYGKKDCVDLRARFTEVYNFLLRLRNDKRPPLPPYDAASERKRRTQLERLQNRTQKEIDEHKLLKEQERKIKSNKEERERRHGNMHMRINGFKARTSAGSDSPRPPASRQSSASGGATTEKPQIQTQGKKTTKKGTEKKKGEKRNKVQDIPAMPGLTAVLEANLKFPEIKAAGAHARSARLKLPNSVSSKKTIALKSMLGELGLDDMPMANEETIDEFNKLRSDLLLLYELKTAVVNAQTDLNHLRIDMGDKADDPQIGELLERADAVLRETSEQHLSSRLDIAPSTLGSRYRRKTTADSLKTPRASTSNAD